MENIPPTIGMPVLFAEFGITTFLSNGQNDWIILDGNLRTVG